MKGLGGKLVLIAAVLLASCSKPEVKIPKSLLQPEIMVPMLVDVHVIEGARNGALILGDTNGIEDYYAKVYEKFGVSEKLFKESFLFYSKHPGAFIPVYEAVLDSLKINGELLARRGVELEYDED